MFGIGRADGFCAIAFGLQRGGFDLARTFPHDVFGAVACYLVDGAPYHECLLFVPGRFRIRVFELQFRVVGPTVYFIRFHSGKRVSGRRGL